MQKFLAKLIFILLISMPVAFASSSANINLRISGAKGDNRYFFCLPDIGCLSILAADEGKVYPIFHAFQMNSMYVTDMQNFRVYAQGLPESCNVNVDVGQTITIHGHLSDYNQNVYVSGLYCSVSQ